MIKYTVSFTILLVLVCFKLSCAQGRIKQSINTGWKFYKGNIDPTKDTNMHDYGSDGMFITTPYNFVATNNQVLKFTRYGKTAELV
jgi:hypothetical protein